MTGSVDGRDRLDVSEWVDDRPWPLLVIRWPSGPVPDLDLARAFDRIREIVARDEAHVVLLRAEDARAPTHVQLGLLIDLVRWAAPRSRCGAVAVVTRSSIVRATVDSVRWMALTAARWETFDDEAAATRWLEGQPGGGGRAAIDAGRPREGRASVEGGASAKGPESTPPAR